MKRRSTLHTEMASKESIVILVALLQADGIAAVAHDVRHETL